MNAERGPRRGDGAIARLLGEECATGGPFALLRLTPEICTDDTIIAGLDNQLSVLAVHPECDTPEADEARLALHAAAAQLLDAKVRAYLIANWQESNPGAAPRPMPGQPVARPTPRPQPTRTRAQLSLEHDAILTLGLYGGWNKRSLRRLVSLAHARGMDATQVARTVNTLSSRRRGAPQAAVAPAKRPGRDASDDPQAPTARRDILNVPPPEPAERRQGADMRVLGLALAIIASMVFIAVVLGLVVMVVNADKTQDDSAPDNTAPTSVNASPTNTTNTIAPDNGTLGNFDPNPGLITLTEQAIASPAAIARATKAISIDQDEAMLGFERAVSSLQGAWPRIPSDTHVAAQHEIIEFMYRSSTNATISERAFHALAQGIEALQADGIISGTTLWPAIWSAGMLTRLSSESDLSGTLRQRLAGELIAALRERRVVQNPTFRAGALAALDAVAESFSPNAKPSFPWEQWANAAAALSDANPKAREALMLDALELVLLEGGEPTDDKGTFDAIRLLAKRVPWRDGDESRRQLLAWFLDERLTSADLHALTTTLARESSASGVDVTMVLPLLATDEVRQQLRGRYATAWGMTGGVDRQTVTAGLATAARDAMRDLPSDAVTSDYLIQTVRLSRLSEAIAWAWRGRSQEADELHAALEDNLDFTSATSITSTAALDQRTPQDAGRGTSWAARYLAAKQRAAIRIDLLDQLEASAIPDAVAAEILVREALRGSPAQVRKRAQEVVMYHASDAAVANAMLEQLPTIPRTYDNAMLIESITFAVLPEVSDKDWPFQARRVLVDHLLDVLSAGGQFGAVDGLVDQLTISYVGRSSRAPLVGPDRVGLASTDAALAATLLYRQWRSGLDRAMASRAASISADAADRLRTGRLELASGPIQQFAASQASICEVMAIVISGEQPAAASRVEGVIDEMTNDRRRAANAFQQVFAVEEAMLRLWLIRIGEQNI